MNSARNLYMGVIYEVLMHASMKIVKGGECRLFSKECNKFTYESIFIKLHNQKPTSSLHYLYKAWSWKNIMFHLF